jgi:hypothetical protein
MDQDLDTNRIKDWRSIVTLIVFVLASEFPAKQLSIAGAL